MPTNLAIAVPAGGVGAATDVSQEQPVMTFNYAGAADDDIVSVESSGDNANWSGVCTFYGSGVFTKTLNANFVRCRRIRGSAGVMSVMTSAGTVGP